MAFLFVPLTFFWLIFHIWLIQNGLTFNPTVDYMSLLAIIAAVVMVRKVKTADLKVSFPLLLANLVLLSCWPILHHIELWALANEFQRVKHSWPQMLVDDPKNWYGHVSPQFDALYDFVGSFFSLGLFWMVLWIALFMVSWRRLNVLWRFLLPALVGFWINVFLNDPGGLFAWWLD